LSTISEATFASKSLHLHPDDPGYPRVNGGLRDPNRTLDYQRLERASCDGATPSHPQGASTLTDQHPPPPPAAPASRLRAVTWMNTRTALGTCLVLTAILAGAVFLDHAQRLVPCN
jgi:hypothetical protein